MGRLEFRFKRFLKISLEKKKKKAVRDSMQSRVRYSFIQFMSVRMQNCSAFIRGVHPKLTLSLINNPPSKYERSASLLKGIFKGLKISSYISPPKGVHPASLQGDGTSSWRENVRKKKILILSVCDLND